MPVAMLDPKTALIVVDLQKGIINSPFIHPIAGVIERSMSLEAHQAGRSSRAVSRPSARDSAI